MFQSNDSIVPSSGVFIDLTLQISSNQVLLEKDLIIESLDVFECLNDPSNPKTNDLYRVFLSFAIMSENWESMRTGNLISYSFSDVVKMSDDLSKDLIMTRRILDESNRFRNNFIRIHMNVRMRTICSSGNTIFSTFYPGEDKDSALSSFETTMKKCKLSCTFDPEYALLGITRV